MNKNSRVLATGENQITQKFSVNHGGIDLVKNYNQLDSITAHSSGTVVFCQSGYGNKKGAKGNESYGNCVKIKHENGYYSLYAHLNSVYVKLGEKVSQGEKIGYMGNTGNSFGAHLHFEIRDKNDKRIDPQPYINADFEQKYSTGNYIVDTAVLNVRKGPDIGYDFIRYENLSPNAQSQIDERVDYKANGYVKGMVCTVYKVEDNWGKTPSGWICLDYCKINAKKPD